jgi:hypothetical protein
VPSVDDVQANLTGRRSFMTETSLVKGVFVVVLAVELLTHPTLHTETVHYVPTTTIVHNGGQVITATASTIVIPSK